MIARLVQNLLKSHELLRCCSGLKLLTHFLFGNHEYFWMYKHSTCLTWQISTVFFWWLSLPATQFTSIYRITALHILHFIPRIKDLYQLLYTVPFTLKAASFMEVCSLDDRWSFAASNSPMHSIHRCTWKSLQFFIIIIMMASFMRVL